MIEPLSFAEIGIAHAAGIPWTDSVTLIVTREPRSTARDSLLSTAPNTSSATTAPAGGPRGSATGRATGPGSATGA